MFVTFVVIARPLWSRGSGILTLPLIQSARVRLCSDVFPPPPAALAQAGPSSVHPSAAADEDGDDEEDAADAADEDEELQF